MALKKIDIITRWREEGLDSYGVSTYSAPVNVPGRWNEKIGEIPNDRGEMIESMGSIYTNIDDDFKLNDRVALGANANMDVSYVVRGIEKNRNGSGTKLLLVAYLGKG